jgi:hypothetical protein
LSGSRSIREDIAVANDEDSESKSPKRRRIPLEDLEEGREVSETTPINPDLGFTAIRVAGVKRLIKIQPCTYDTTMCGW